MNRYKVDISSSKVFINEKPCKSVVSLYLEVNPSSSSMECEIVCIDQNDYTGYWEEHRVFGYIERVYSSSYYLVVKNAADLPYFQQFSSACHN